MRKKRLPTGYWDDVDRIKDAISQSKGREDFRINFRGAYNAAHRLGIYYDLVKDIPKKRAKITEENEYTIEELKELSKKYPTRTLMARNNIRAYNDIKNKGLEESLYGNKDYKFHNNYNPKYSYDEVEKILLEKNKINRYIRDFIVKNNWDDLLELYNKRKEERVYISKINNFNKYISYFSNCSTIGEVLKLNKGKTWKSYLAFLRLNKDISEIVKGDIKFRKGLLEDRSDQELRERLYSDNEFEPKFNKILRKLFKDRYSLNKEVKIPKRDNDAGRVDYLLKLDDYDLLLCIEIKHDDSCWTEKKLRKQISKYNRAFRDRKGFSGTYLVSPNGKYGFSEKEFLSIFNHLKKKEELFLPNSLDYFKENRV